MIPFKLKRVEPKAIRNPISPFRCSVRNQNVPMIPKNILNSKNPITAIWFCNSDFTPFLNSMLYLKSEYGMTSSKYKRSMKSCFSIYFTKNSRKS